MLAGADTANSTNPAIAVLGNAPLPSAKASPEVHDNSTVPATAAVSTGCSVIRLPTPISTIGRNAAAVPTTAARRDIGSERGVLPVRTPYTANAPPTIASAASTRSRPGGWNAWLSCQSSPRNSVASTCAPTTSAANAASWAAASAPMTMSTVPATPTDVMMPVAPGR